MRTWALPIALPIGQSRTYQEVCLLSCTLLHKWVQCPILWQNLIDTKCCSRSYQRRNVPGVICNEKWDIMVHFTWGTLPLARHADCGRWVTGSLQHCHNLVLSGLLFHFAMFYLGKFPSGSLIIWGALPLEAGTHCCRCCHRIHTPGQRLPGTPPGNLARQCSITTRFFLLVLDARGTLQFVRFPNLYFGTIQLGNLTTLQRTLYCTMEPHILF